MLSYLEYLKQYLGLPAKIIAPIVVLFAVSQLVGEILSLKGKLVPEFFTFRKYLARKRKEREAIRELPEVIKEFQKYDLDDFKEVVFCGFGEPTERIDDIVQVAGILKLYRRDLPIRINTNGLGNLIHDRDITPLLKGRIDTVSISLNAPDEKEYYELTRNKFGIESYSKMLEFASLCKEYVPYVVLTVVDIIGEEKIKKCQKICDELGVKLRVREFEE